MSISPIKPRSQGGWNIWNDAEVTRGHPGARWIWGVLTMRSRFLDGQQPAIFEPVLKHGMVGVSEPSAKGKARTTDSTTSRISLPLSDANNNLGSRRAMLA